MKYLDILNNLLLKAIKEKNNAEIKKYKDLIEIENKRYK